MTIHTHYQAWTYADVRARIIEAAETLLMQPADRGPGFAGLMNEVVREVSESYGYSSSGYRRIPSAGALARMEETWTWINTWLTEDDRKLVYEYGFVQTRKGLTLARWCEENGWIKRTFERAVARCCQRIADSLNRKHHIRLTTDIDGLSQNQAEEQSSKVVSDNCASVKRKPYHRTDDAIPAHIPGSEAEIVNHIEKVNKVRRQEAERQRKAALKRAEESARIAARHAEKEAKRRKAAA